MMGYVGNQLLYELYWRCDKQLNKMLLGKNGWGGIWDEWWVDLRQASSLSWRKWKSEINQIVTWSRGRYIYCIVVDLIQMAVTKRPCPIVQQTRWVTMPKIPPHLGTWRRSLFVNSLSSWWHLSALARPSLSPTPPRNPSLSSRMHPKRMCVASSDADFHGWLPQTMVLGWGHNGSTAP